MDLSRLQAAPSASSVPIEKLEGNARLSEAEKVAEATRQFESILLRQILTAARKPMLHTDDDGAPTAAEEVYHDMVTNQLADAISRSGSFGLARSLHIQLRQPPGDTP